MQLLQFPGMVMVKRSTGFEVFLPAVTADGHFHDLGRALINCCNSNVPLDLFDHVLLRVTVAAMGLDGRLGRRIAGFRAEVLGDGARPILREHLIVTVVPHGVRVSDDVELRGEVRVDRRVGAIELVELVGEDRDRFDRAIKRPNGIFLVTGPTGSGKTTTLYAALKMLNKPNVKIITAENPIE